MNFFFQSGCNIPLYYEMNSRKDKGLEYFQTLL